MAVPLAGPPPAGAGPRPDGAADGVALDFTAPPLLFNLRLRWEVHDRIGIDATRNAATVLVDHNGLPYDQREKLVTNDRYRSMLANRDPRRDRGIRTEPVDLDVVAPYLKAGALADLRGRKIEKLLAVSALNAPRPKNSGAFGSYDDEGAHSEVVLKNFLKPFGAVPVLLGASDRRQCWSCTGLYPADIPLFYGVEYDLSSEEVARMRREAAAAEQAVADQGARARRLARDKVVKKWSAVGAERNRMSAARIEALYHKSVSAFRAADADMFKASSTILRIAPNDCELPSAPWKPGGSGLGAAFVLPVAGRQACPSRAAPTGLSRALTEPGALPGGIDFSSLELRYLADPGDGSGLRYAFAMDRAPLTGDSRTATGLAAARQTSDAFFVWLALDRSDLWVNLHPEQPDRIVDERLGRTEAGRVMLEADLRLKRDVGAVVHPRTSTGRAYWAELKGDCAGIRVWIVPGAAQVYEDGDALYILDAPLTVRLEDPVDETGPAQSEPEQTGPELAGPGRTACDLDAEERAHNERLGRRIVLPRVEHLVNTAPQYAELRRIHFARVAAEWYRGLSLRKDTAYRKVIGSGSVEPWRIRSGWRPQDTFRKYVASYRKGEYRAGLEVVPGLDPQEVVYGGVDFGEAPVRPVSGERFAAEHPELAARVAGSLTDPKADTTSDTVWLGAPTPLERATRSAPAAGGLGVTVGLVAAGAAAVAAAALFVVVHRRRSSRRGSEPETLEEPT
ncbi:hypothetical protein ACGFMM_24170 [Streptomyces sp. NPDC048604]|uniref:hypothetical protein n=1 Tax=Streptomyces sp. NPDC048604 TaxID=3365578 RepID=UPI003716524D